MKRWLPLAALLVTSTAAALGLVVASGPQRSEAVEQPGAPFDFYISESGDDDNAGTLAEPWSICALNSRMADYDGLRIGIIGTSTIRNCRDGGVTTSLYSRLQAASGIVPAVQIQGGASTAAKTYIGSSDADGNYSARAALIDATNPSGGAHSTNDAVLFGQMPGGNITQWGNVEIQGIRIRGGTFVTLGFYHPNSDSLEGLYFHDNEFYDQLAPESNDNPGVIFGHNWKAGATDAATNRIVNNYCHDNQTAGGSISPWGLYCVITFESEGVYLGYNTIRNGIGFFGKDYLQDALIEFNYIDTGEFGSGTPAGTLPAIRGYISATGRTTTIRHNIIIGAIMIYGGDQLGVEGNYLVDHNTFYQSQNDAWNQFWKLTSSARLTITNNLHYWAGTLYGDGTYAFHEFQVTGTQLTACNYNGYRSTARFETHLFQTSGLTFAQWQSYGGYGFDANSITYTSSPFLSTPQDADPDTFAVTGAAATASSTGGALGANVSQVGADWVTPP